MHTVEFSLKRVGEENLHYYESDTESPIQLVFVPGGLNPEIWKQQLRYFSKSFKTVSFQPTVSFRDYQGEKEALRNVLEQEKMNNVVLISHAFGNSMIQEFEDRDDVISTVMTSPRRKFEKIPPRKVCNWMYKLGKFKPKIAKKIFFSEKTDYRIVREFTDTIEKPDYRNMKTFLDNYRVSRPSKEALVIHPAHDRLSSVDFAQELKPNASISSLQGSGTFCFFEKPQEYNKALLDFLNLIKDKAESEKIIEVKKKNRSLMEFEKQDEEEDFKSEMKKIKV